MKITTLLQCLIVGLFQASAARATNAFTHLCAARGSSVLRAQEGGDDDEELMEDPSSDFEE
jgi:hypothetical protein